MSTTSQRLDAARKEARELRQKLGDAHTAMPNLPAAFLSYYAELCLEATSPTRVAEQAQTSRPHPSSRPPARNDAAVAEKRRVDAQLLRIAQRGLGDETGQGGTLNRIIYGKDRGWRPTGASTTSQT